MININQDMEIFSFVLIHTVGQLYLKQWSDQFQESLLLKPLFNMFNGKQLSCGARTVSEHPGAGERDTR